MNFDIETLLALGGLLLVAGAAVGFLAGLFGVGGGAVSVPVLYEAFGFMGIDDGVRMPLAVGTSLALIVPTSLQSARSHYLRGAMDLRVLRQWAVPILIGVSIGSVVARYADPWVFKLVFIGVAGLVSVRMLRGSGWNAADTLPGKGLMRLFGMVIGFLSSLMGIGGGAISNLILSLFGTPIHRAVATSAGVGVLISIPGAIGYIYAGWGKAGLPPDALGYVSILGFLLLLPTSFLTTRFGVQAAHALKKRQLEVLFGLFLMTVCLRFIYDMFIGGAS
ncbi:sulfite exporter TauE/SafE family protein [Mycoplana rhizolycopersici]|uniref:Probable membrane transporter protein n=1 Tax=Mycoplana rhizolycopersici TaxID=2746702 RepID=A0ABX2QKW2_9HYPH|nr:sulfite exporter TauE/SafE family protein [Rhizobium rhizolycopersici]NVP56939.1 sulfite exporter TauE/SafE family protein [Rhizobium rhizolycopersici]